MVITLESSSHTYRGPKQPPLMGPNPHLQIFPGPETNGLLLKNGGLETTFLLGNLIFRYCVSFGEGIHNLEDFGRHLLFFVFSYRFFLDDMFSTWQAIP